MNKADRVTLKRAIDRLEAWADGERITAKPLVGSEGQAHLRAAENYYAVSMGLQRVLDHADQEATR
jgi:hypothetical protein